MFPSILLSERVKTNKIYSECVFDTEMYYYSFPFWLCFIWITKRCTLAYEFKDDKDYIYEGTEVSFYLEDAYNKSKDEMTKNAVNIYCEML